MNNDRYFTYRGSRLQQCYMPLGGIGAGNVTLNGYGKLVRWELFNVVNSGYEVPHFFAVSCRVAGGSGIARVLNSRPSGHLLQRNVGQGEMGLYPHVRETVFRGSYPFAEIEYRDPELPVAVSLEAYTPFIPHNSRDSGIPAVLFNFTVRNTTRRRVEGSLLSLCCNPVGNGGLKRPRPVLSVNTPVRKPGRTGLRFSARGIPKGDIAEGEMMWVAEGDRAAVVPYLEWMDLDEFWRHFEKAGTANGFPSRSYTRERRQPGYGWFGALGAPFRLAPGETRTVTLALCWCFPNLRGALRCSPENEAPAFLGHAYSRWFRRVDDVARYVTRHRARLESDTRRFRDTLFESTLPTGVLDAVSANLAILGSTTVMWGGDGRLYGFEGSNPDSGSCPMNCTHVWNYEQSLAHLFPDLERTMRDADFTVQQHPSGRIEDRYRRPPVCEEPQLDKTESIDGHLGCILKLYREHLRSPDQRFLRQYYPAMLKAMDYAVATYDPNETGMPGGLQHTTFDCNLWGPNTFIGAYYLAALRAVEESAKRMGDERRAGWARTLFLKGQSLQERRLFNGEYFIQRPLPGEPKDRLVRNYLSGCLTDQLIGQWWADLLDLGDLYAPEKIESALAAILRYNRRRPLEGHACFNRVFADADQNGVIVCTWPRGGSPHWPLSYNDECWPGSEYTIASLLIERGHPAGVGVAHDVRQRHRGDRRSPWNEQECGEFYARSLSSWGLLVAASGFQLDAPRGILRLAPRLSPAKFGCLVTGAEGWGFFHQERKGSQVTAALNWRFGTLHVKQFSLGRFPWTPASVRVRVDGQPMAMEWSVAEREVTVTFGARQRFTDGSRLDMRIAL